MICKIFKIAASVALFCLLTIAAYSQTKEELYKQGLELADKGKLAEAAGKFEAALKIDSTFRKAHTQLIFTKAKMGEYDDLVDSLNTEIVKTSSYAYIQGIIDLESGYYDSAVQHFDIALQRDPENYDAAYAQFIAYEHTGNWGGALMAYTDLSGSENKGLGFAGGPDESYEELSDKRLKKLASENRQNSEGQTILHAAVQKGDISLIQKLLEYGADPNIEDNSGKKPIEYTDNVAIKALLEDYMKK